MSEGIDNKNTATDSEKPVEDAEIVDAEVLREDERPAEPETMKTVEQPISHNKSGSKAGWITAAVLSAFIGGVYASPYFEAGLVSLGLRSAPQPENLAEVDVDLAPINAEIADLHAAIARHQEMLAQQHETANENARAQDQLQKDIALLAGSQNPAGVITSGADIAALKSDVARLTDDLARLSTLNSEADPAVAQLTGSLALARAESAQLKERLTTIEASLQAVEAGALEASPRGRLVLVLSRMKDRALAGLSFGAELTGLRSDIAELPALDQQLMGAEIAVLENTSEGIRPYAALVRDFEPAVAAALHAGEKEQGNFLSSLFTARRTDAGATGDDAVFVKAERLLLARDVAGAVEALGALTGKTVETLEPWRMAAESHVIVTRAFDRLIQAAAQAGPGLSVGGVQ